MIYVIIGAVMLKPGWLNRYLPPIAQTVVPDVAVAVGFVWAGLMFVSAAVNAFVAITCSLATWCCGDADLRHREQSGGVRRRICCAPPDRAAAYSRPARPERDALLAAAGRA